MADANPSRLGQINQQGSTDALFLKVFAGEVLTSFARTNLMLDRTMVRTISHGKSASFPVIGRIGAEYHTPGNEILGQKVNHNEVVITIDQLLISHAFIADIDEAMNHYDVRAPYSTEMGRKLAKTTDVHIMRELIKAARKGANVADAGYPGGTEIISDSFKNDGGVSGSEDAKALAIALTEGLFAAAQALDENDAPEEERYAVFSPREYYTLFNNTDLINSRFGGRGSIASGDIFQVAGINILKSNNVPHDDSSGETYHGVDATKTVALVWTPPAVGTVKLMDLSMQMEWDIRRQGTLMVARYAMGHGPVRPECAVELRLDSLTYLDAP